MNNIAEGKNRNIRRETEQAVQIRIGEGLNSIVHDPENQKRASSPSKNGGLSITLTSIRARTGARGKCLEITQK